MTEGRDDADPSVGRRAAVLGSPIAHSLSPVLHGAAYRALGLTGWRYDRIECTEDQLPGLVAGLGSEWRGFSLTMPLKRVLLELPGRVSDLAAAVGSGNTLVLGEPEPWIDNTDVHGLVAALAEAGVRSAKSVVILGAGGTAQGALAAARELGVREPTVLVRDVGRSGDLQATAERLGVRPRISGDLLSGPLPEADLVISTLPAGAADSVAAYPWPGETALLDVVYAGWPTRLAVTAAQAGAVVVSGLGVLLHQAVPQVEQMTGRTAPLEAMRAAVEEAAGLPTRGGRADRSSDGTAGSRRPSHIP